MNPRISAELALAYRDTVYVAAVPKGEIIIRIGSTSTLMDELLAVEGQREWAYLSASNPGSSKLTEEENSGRFNKLRSVLTESGKVFFEGYSRADDGRWPDEKSALVIGISLNEALEIGRRFGQLAIVSGARGGQAILTDCQTGKSV